MARDISSHAVVRLWPEGPPKKLAGAVGPEVTFRGPAGVAAETVMLRNVADPTLTIFRPTAAKPNGIDWLADQGFA